MYQYSIFPTSYIFWNVSFRFSSWLSFLTEGCYWSKCYYDTIELTDIMAWLTVTKYLHHRGPRICFICRGHNPVLLSSFMTYHLPEHPSSPPVLSGVRVTRSFVLYVCFVDRFLSFCTFSFGHCVVCSSSIYGLWLPLWYLQTLLRMSTMTGAINGTGTAYPSEILKLNLSFKSSSHCSIFCLSLDALWRYGRCVVIQYILMVAQYFITCSPNFDTKYVVEIQNSNFNRPLPVSLQLVPLS